MAKVTTTETVQGSDDNDGFVLVEAPKEIVMPTDELKKDTILFWIERSKNGNIVCYEALKKGNCDKYNDVDGYWLCIDQSWVEKKRKKGIMTDREGMTYIEKKLAFGWNVSNPSKDCYELSLVALPSCKMTIITDDDGLPHAVAVINGHKCYVRKIYVMAKQHWYGLPTVEYIEVTGIQIDNGCIQKTRKIVS